jgi:hypothetical protein
MPRYTPNDQYPNVNEIGDEQGLLWDGLEGSPYGLKDLVDPALWDERFAERYEDLFDHTIRFRPRGGGRRIPVMAVSAPYLRDGDSLREAVLTFCSRFGLAARVGDERYRIYSALETLPIVFWRPDKLLLR